MTSLIMTPSNKEEEEEEEKWYDSESDEEEKSLSDSLSEIGIYQLQWNIHENHESYIEPRNKIYWINKYNIVLNQIVEYKTFYDNAKLDNKLNKRSGYTFVSTAFYQIRMDKWWSTK